MRKVWATSCYDRTSLQWFWTTSRRRDRKRTRPIVKPAASFATKSGAMSTPRSRSICIGLIGLPFEELAQNGVRRETVPDPSIGARRSLCASEELARTTEPDSAGQSRVPGSLEGRVRPVRASEELAQNGVRREAVLGPSGGARRTLCASSHSSGHGSVRSSRRRTPTQCRATTRSLRK